MDSSTTLTDLKSAVDQFVVVRNWYRYHTAKNLAMSIAIEAAEIMEHFQWQDSGESSAQLLDEQVKDEVADELADVLIYCLSFANVTGIDVSEAIRKKMARNEGRFPIEQVNGELGKQ